MNAMASAPRDLDRPAFYALRSGGWRDLVTLLHPPYTAWHLSYVALGAAAAPHIYAGRLAAALGAFFLAVGISAHALDELHGRPLGTRLSRATLIVLAATSLVGALAIGIAGVIVVSPLLAPLVLAGVVLVPAYNLELGGGRFHNDTWFALAWGGFPAFTGYFANALAIRPAGLLVAGACCLRERCPAPAQHSRAPAAAQHNRGGRASAPARRHRDRAHRRRALGPAGRRAARAFARDGAALGRLGGGEGVGARAGGRCTALETATHGQLNNPRKHR